MTQLNSRYIDVSLLDDVIHELNVKRQLKIDRSDRKFLDTVLSSFPDADVRINDHREWMLDDTNGYYCPNCKESPLKDDYGNFVFSNFCPNCGQDMRRN